MYRTRRPYPCPGSAPTPFRTHYRHSTTAIWVGVGEDGYGFLTSGTLDINGREVMGGGGGSELVGRSTTAG